MSLLTGKTLKYGLSWAESIIARLTEAHARATEISLEVLQITPRQLARLLAAGLPEYYIIRESIRRLAHWEEIRPKDAEPMDDALCTKLMLSELIRRATEFKSESLRLHLTRRKNEIDLKSQLKGRVPEGATATEGTQPFSSGSSRADPNYGKGDLPGQGYFEFYQPGRFSAASGTTQGETPRHTYRKGGQRL